MPPDDDDRDLFRQLFGDVKRVRSDKAEPVWQRPRPAARFRRLDEAQVMEESLSGTLNSHDLETGEELLFRRPHLRPGDLRKLRRGHIPVAEEIDLHGLTADEAHSALAEFLSEAVTERKRCVRVIHGKGLRSGPGGPVIKRRIGRWLRRRDEVLAFCSARPMDGGTGAVYVLLKTGP